jgi:hypothetical protein
VRQMLLWIILAAVVLPMPPANCAEDVTPSAIDVGATLNIVGPTDAVQPDDDAWLKIDGLTLDEIKSAKAAGMFDMTVFPLEGVRVHATYDWLNETLELLFTAKNPGDYLVKLHLVRDGRMEIAAIVVAVEGDDRPDPQPGPEPQPGPVPRGTRLALVLHESSEITPQQAAVTDALRRHLAGNSRCLYRLMDKDTPAQGQWTAPYLEQVQAKGLSLPVWAVSVLADKNNKLSAPYIVFVESLPATAEQAIAKVEEALK